LESEGWTVPSSVTIEVKPDVSQHHLVLALPKKPEGISDEALTKKAEDTICLHHCYRGETEAVICIC